jgi:prepilin-type N-terminal cleavage/methylation domain-containing protein
LRGCSAASGFTLPEVLIATGLGVLVATVLATLALFGARAFAAFGNYQDLDSRGRVAADFIGRELREATAVVGCYSNLPVKALVFWNAQDATTNTLIFDSAAHTLTFEKTDWGSKLLLRDCDQWDFALYNGAPSLGSTNISFAPAASLAEAKVVQLSWRCSRTMVGQGTTETSQAARILLRNNSN